MNLSVHVLVPYALSRVVESYCIVHWLNLLLCWMIDYVVVMLDVCYVVIMCLYHIFSFSMRTFVYVYAFFSLSIWTFILF